MGLRPRKGQQPLCPMADGGCPASVSVAIRTPQAGIRPQEDLPDCGAVGNGTASQCHAQDFPESGVAQNAFSEKGIAASEAHSGQTAAFRGECPTWVRPQITRTPNHPLFYSRVSYHKKFNSTRSIGFYLDFTTFEAQSVNVNRTEETHQFAYRNGERTD